MKGKFLWLMILPMICLASMAVSVLAQEPFNINCIRQFDYNWHAQVLDVCVQGNYAYAACDYEGLRIIDISEPSSYREAAHLDRGRIMAIAVDGQFAYIGSSDDSLFVIDISTKSDPQVIAALGLPGFKFTIKIFGERIFVCTSSGLKVLDVSNPSEPEMVWNYTDFETHDIAVVNNMAYIACNYGKLRIFDISNIEVPVLSGVIGPENDDGVFSVGIYGNNAVLACGWLGFRIYDLTTSLMVSQIDSLKFALWVKVSDEYAYLAYGYPECPLAIINIANPIAPQLTSIYYPPEDIAAFDVVENNVYVADYRHGLRTVDISDRANPHETTPYNRFGFENKVALSGSTAYSMSTFKLTAFDFSNPSDPGEFGYFESNWELSDFKLVGDTAYVLSGEPTVISTVDFSNPSNPVILDQVIPEGYSNYYRISIYGNYLYLIGWESTIIYDISNPSEITEAGSFEIATNGHTNYTFDHYLILQTRNEQLIMFDLANPLAPGAISTFRVGGHCFEMRVSNDVLYAVMYTQLYVIDISNPASWRLLTVEELGNDGLYQGNHCELYGDFLYLASEGYGLAVYDISSPGAPERVGYYDTPGTAKSVAVNDNIALVADFTGLGIYDCSDALGTSDRSIPNLPTQLALLPNYPNPFNSSTVIRFEIGTKSNVAIDIVDLLGRQVAVLVDGIYESGQHSIRWDGSDMNGQVVSSGHYFVRAQSGGISKNLPVTLLK